jgi:hypothetical protein
MFLANNPMRNRPEFVIDFRSFFIEFIYLLHRDYPLNLSYTKPTYTLVKADPVKQEKFKEEFWLLVKQLVLGEIDHILFEDESSGKIMFSI